MNILSLHPLRDEQLETIKNAERPVFHAGYGIRLSGGYDAFRRVAEKLNTTVSNLTDVTFSTSSVLMLNLLFSSLMSHLS